jgi:hypothetical protein
MRSSKIATPFQRSGRFQFIMEVDDLVYIAGPILNLTAYCSPRIKRMHGYQVIDYDLGLTVLSDLSRSEQEFLNNIALGRCVSLHRSVPTRHSLDAIMRDGKVSEWLVEDILMNLTTYSMPARDAVEFIENAQDPQIEKYKRVYGDRFTEYILGPLYEACAKLPN